MKKLFALFIISALTAGTALSVSAADRVSVVIDTQWIANQSVNDAYFDLYSAEGEYLGTQQSEVITNNKNVITFQTPEYEPGAEFVLRMNYGYSLLQYYDDIIGEGGSFTLGTYSYSDGENTVVNDTFHLTGVPHSAGKMNLTVDGRIVPLDVKLYKGVPMAPIDLLLDSIDIPWYEQNYDYQTRNITITHDGTSLVMNMDNELVFINGSPATTDTGLLYIDDKFYAPAGFVLSVFNVPVGVSENNGAVNINAIVPRPVVIEQPAPAEEKMNTDTGSSAAPAQSADNDAEAFVNNSGISSRTDYLIWISKKDYKVNVFLGSAGNWKLCRSMTCAIGKSSSPTITGQFEYYSRESRLTYDDFYVGPIMRFKNGYAIHSTLLSYDGGDYDARVGQKLSHGCVRVRKADIDWLVSYVPLYTRIYITD